MTDNNTYTILSELQKNLEDLASAKVQMEEFRSVSKNVVDGIGNVQEEFLRHLIELEADYKQKVIALEGRLSSFLSKNQAENESTNQKFISISNHAIDQASEKFITIANKVEVSNNEKISAITDLIEQHKNIVEASRSLIDTLNAIDFPTKLDAINTKSQLIIESINNAKQALELKSNETNTLIIDKTATLKDLINQHVDAKFQLFSELLNSTKENLSKIIADKINEQAAESKTRFENLNKYLRESIDQINQRHDKQDKKINLLKKISIVLIVLSIVGAIFTILVLK